MKWMDIAKSLIGTREVPGTNNNQTIIGWAKQLTKWIGSFYKNDEIPWCGLFVAHCLQAANLPTMYDKSLGALNWKDYGVPASARLGVILVFKRPGPGAGHVGFYVSEDADNYHVLGGNQGDMVCVKKIAKNRCVAIRWPTGVPVPANSVKIVKYFDGKVSSNEA